MTQPGYLTTLLTMRLPDLRPFGGSDLERRWLADTLVESYLPIFETLDRLSEQGVSWRLALAPSPNLLRMLSNPECGEIAAQAIETRRKIVQREMDRNRRDEELYGLAEYYDDRLARMNRILHERCEGIPLRALQNYAQSEMVEFIAGPDAHAYLPSLAGSPEAIRSQIRGGLDCMESLLGVRPSGFLLPEMGYDHTIAPLLVAEGILYTFVDSQAILLAQPRPPAGWAIPVATDSGLFVFGIDAEANRRISDKEGGYAEDLYYRSNERDLGFDADLERILPFLPSDGQRIATGIKYYRKSEADLDQELYHPSWAMDRCVAHAADFLSQRRIQLNRLEKQIGRPALVTVRLEAEFLGLGWHEGSIWLEEMLGRSTERRDELIPMAPTEYLTQARGLPVCAPEVSSVGTDGYHQDWINEETAWFWPHLQHAISTFASMERAHSQPDVLMRQALTLAESVLRRAQSADWLALMSIQGWSGFAMEKTVELLKIFNFLATEVQNKTLDLEKLEEIEKRLAEVKESEGS